LEAAGERKGKIAFEMPLVKFVEEDDRNSAKLSVASEYLAEEDALSDEADARGRTCDVVETNLVTHLVSKSASSFGGDARRKQARRETPGLQHDNLAVAEQTAISEDLRDLGGFARAGRRGEEHARMLREGAREIVRRGEDGEVGRHGGKGNGGLVFRVGAMGAAAALRAGKNPEKKERRSAASPIPSETPNQARARAFAAADSSK